MRIAEKILVHAPRQAIWERIGDPTQWPRELGRMHCTHLPGSPDQGPGARYWLHIEVGAAEVGSLIEILEHEPNSALSWTTIEGLEQRGHWRLRDHGDGHTEVTLSVSYQAAGGLAALLTDEISSLPIRRYVRDALSTLARQLEAGPRQEPAGATRLLRSSSHLLGDGVHAARALTHARLIRPARPDRYARALNAIARWGPRSAGGYAAAAALYPDDPAVIDEHGTLTFAQLQERTNHLARALSDHGIGTGSQIAVMCRNHHGLLETLVASCKLSAYTLLLDTGLTGAQANKLIKGERPQAVIYDAEFGELLRPSLHRRKSFIAWAEPGETRKHNTLEEIIDPATPLPPAHDRRPRILTPPISGTPTGALRGSPADGAALAILDSIPLRSRERLLVGAPLSSRWGYANSSLAALLANTLVLQRHFEAEATLAAIERERISCYATAPIMLQRILELPLHMRRRYDTSTLQTVTVSGSALPAALARSFMDEYGEILYSLHGNSDAGWVTIARPTDLRRAPGTVGRPLRHTTVRVLDEDSIPVRTGQTGKIFLANKMLEHHTGAIQRPDGLVATGEKGHLDDHGRLFLQDDEETIPSDTENADRRAPANRTTSPGASPTTRDGR